MPRPRPAKRQPFVVAIDAPFPAEQLAQLRRLHRPGPGIEVLEKLTPEALARANAIYTGDGDFDPTDAPNLRFIQANTAAVNHLMSKPVASGVVPLCNVTGAYSPATAEFCIALLLMVTRKLDLCYRHQLAHHFPVEAAEYPPMQGLNLYGQTIGIIGYGSIGRQIARITRAMGMKVLACKRRPGVHADASLCLPDSGDARGNIPARWFSQAQLKKMLALSRVVVVMVPLTPGTRTLFGAAELDAMPQGSYLINLGRGGVVDEAAVAQRLKSGHLAGAGFDVFANEPLEPESPLWDAPNFVMAPHIASYTKEQHPLACSVFIENVRRCLAGKRLLNVVDLKAGY